MLHVRYYITSNVVIYLPELNEEHSKLFKSALDNMIRQPKNISKWWREAMGKFEDALTRKSINYFSNRSVNCFFKLDSESLQGSKTWRGVLC
jgi:hypothetical protein